MVTSVELPKDVLGFIRRECSHCKRHFKTASMPGDGPMIARVLAIEEETDAAFETGWIPDSITCVYCGRTNPLETFLPFAQRSYLESVAKVVKQQVQAARLKLVHTRFALKPAPTYVPVEPPKMPEPSLREPNDMKVMPVLCCSDEVKVQHAWSGAVHCPRCASRQLPNPTIRRTGAIER
jgi:hypothetical protein